jgi:hypothetical protein
VRGRSRSPFPVERSPVTLRMRRAFPLKHPSGVLERQVRMLSALLPEFIRANTDWLQRKIARANGTSPAAQGEFAPVCLLLAEALEVWWRITQDDLGKGMSGHRLREQCREGVSVSEEVFAVITGLAGVPAADAEPAVAFAEAAQTAARVREEFKKLLDWATTPPPSIDLEQLKAAESGPFVRLEDLEARRRSHGS